MRSHSVLSFSARNVFIFLLSLALVNLSSASPSDHHGLQLAARQQTITQAGTAAPAATCGASVSPVTACQDTDLTSANWQAFNVDGFLAEFIQNFGVSAQFPNFFVRQQTPPRNVDASFFCSNMDSTLCTHAQATNPDVATDCAFAAIPGVQNTKCSKYLSPQAAFVVQNWINLWQGVQNEFRAIDDAGNAILASTFINDIVDGLSEEKGSILEAVFQSIANIFVSFLPFGRAFTLSVKLAKNVDKILAKNGEGELGGSLSVVKVALANQQIANEAARTKDQLQRQVKEIVIGTQARMQRVLDLVFNADGGVSVFSLEDAKNTLAFQMASSGDFLDGVPSRAELAAQMETNLKNWIVSSTIKGMGWDLLLDPTELAGDPSVPGSVNDVCRANKGIPNVLGQPCGLFRKNGEFNGARMNNPLVLETLVDFKEAVTNAQACGGGEPDWKATLDGVDGGEGPLPRCLYNFGITTLS